MNTRPLNTPAAGEYVGLAARTLEKLRIVGGGPRFVKLGRAVRYRPVDLDDWLAARLRNSTSDSGTTGAAA